MKPIDQAPAQRPAWLPSYIPELQGLRGMAVLAVVFYHSRPRLAGTPFYGAAQWGWAGVNLFFVLSGFLITSILLESRGKPHYFRNFYGRRALRIWPVYVLTLAICYLKADWFVGEPAGVAIRTAPWWAYLFFVQNLFHLNLPPGIGPTWSLAIEEQYYFLWAPLVRFLKKPWMMAGALGTALVVSPLFRMAHFSWITPTDTVTHLDGIAMGSLIALGLHTLSLSRRAWLAAGRMRHVGGLFAGRNHRWRHSLLGFGAELRLWRVGAGIDCVNRRAKPAERVAAARPAGVLRQNQLRPLHDSHHGVHLLRLV